MRVDLAAKIDELLESRREQEEVDRLERYGETRNRFFASELGFCQRKIAYEFMGMPRQPLNSKTLRVLENGHFLEARYKKYFEEMGILVAEEVSVSTAEQEECPILISGRLDFIIDEGKLNGGEPDHAIVELKSINTWGFKSIANDLQPKPEHMLQVQFYMWLTGIHKGYLVYEDKNDQTNVTIPIVFDDRIIYGDGKSKGIIEQMTELAICIDEKKVPDRISGASPKGFPCKWKTGGCDYFDHCYDPTHEGTVVATPVTILHINGVEFDLENLPAGVTRDSIIAIYNMVKSNEAIKQAEETTEKEPKDVPKEEKKMLVVESEEVKETKENEKKIICSGCNEEIIFKKKGNDGKIGCKKCKTRN